jgi:glutathione S-transferase
MKLIGIPLSSPTRKVRILLEDRSTWWIARQRGKLLRALERLSADLGDNEWCASNHMTLAEVIVGCLMGRVSARLVAFGLRGEFSNLWALWQRLEQRASLERTRMPAQQVELP